MDGYYAFMLVSTALVLMMTTPALALFYGGMTRSKSVLNMMMMSFVAVGIVAITFVLWGWSMGGYFDGGATDAKGVVDFTTAINHGNLNGHLIANPFNLFALHGEISANYIFVMFQFTFAAITVALISGAIADRVKILPWAIFSLLWVTAVYYPIAHNVWGGGWLYHHFPNLDYAGGTVVHINAGIAGAVLAVVIGKRIGFKKEPMRPHNLTLTMTGAGLLWFGWYGFNVGSIVPTVDSIKSMGAVDSKTGLIEAAWQTQFSGETGQTFLNTTLATAAAMLAWLIVERIVHGKFTSLGAASGVVAGLVAITPSCGAVDLGGAIAVGAIAGAVCAVAVGLKYKLNLDDSLDVVGVHLVGGILGALLIGFFGDAKRSAQGIDGLFPAGTNGIFHGGNLTLLGHQAAGVLFTLVWSGVITLVIALAIKYTIGWRVKEDAEIDGIDGDQHGEKAYDLAPGSGILA